MSKGSIGQLDQTIPSPQEFEAEQRGDGRPGVRDTLVDVRGKVVEKLSIRSTGEEDEPTDSTRHPITPQELEELGGERIARVLDEALKRAR